MALLIKIKDKLWDWMEAYAEFRSNYTRLVTKHKSYYL